MILKSYRPKQAAEYYGIGLATLWRWSWSQTREDFPKPIRLSARCTVFDGEQLAAWRDAQAAKVPAPSIIRPIPAGRLVKSMQLLPIAHSDHQTATEPIATVELSTRTDKLDAVVPEVSCTIDDCQSVDQATDPSSPEKAACLAGQTKEPHHA